ncbi:MAG: hypothetical protein IMF07_01755 [Proteobacteria bacterium]|nr:hypothetical protein [Pseudomonadota bacterium]
MSKAKLKLSKTTVECIHPDSPKDIRLMAAEGRLPIEGEEQVAALYYLANDKDPEIKELAHKSLSALPEELLSTAISSPEANPDLLHYLSRHFSNNSTLLGLILKNANTEIKTIESIAASTDDAGLLELIAEDGERVKSNPGIVEAMSSNKAASSSLLKKIGYIVEPGEEEAEPVEEEEEASLYKQILDMGVSQKIKLAITGNKEARTILVKEPNRLICGNVMKNPRITESEVDLFSASKSVGEEVFRLILANRDWMKKYQIKLNLVSNPRVPIPVAMNLLNHIRKKDLELLAKSRNVSKTVSNLAARLLSSMNKKKK